MRFLLLPLAAAPLWAQTAHQQLAREIFKELIEINTTDSSGDNTRAAEAMAARFRKAGFPESDVHVLAPAPKKGNVVVRLRGSGTAKPILFIGHLDVVEALRADWSFDPFVFREQDGFFYGRGTQDTKANDSAMVATFLRMKQENFRPVRDLILALTADEETTELANGRPLPAVHDAGFSLMSRILRLRPGVCTKSSGSGSIALGFMPRDTRERCAPRPQANG